MFGKTKNMLFDFFKTKKSHNLNEFCDNYYSSDIFGSPEGLESEIYYNYLRDLVAGEEVHFLDIDMKDFKTEIQALRTEVFAVAWMHRFDSKASVRQTIATRDYLVRNDLSHLWEIIGDYNLIVAKSTDYSNGYGEAVIAANMEYGNKARMRLFKEFVATGYDEKCVARAVNRFNTKKVWMNSTTAGLLALELCNRLKKDLSDDAKLRIAAILMTHYDEVIKNIEQIAIKK